MHLDVKPSNILLESEDLEKSNIYLADFDLSEPISRERYDTFGTEGEWVGTDDSTLTLTCAHCLSLVFFVFAMFLRVSGRFST